MVMGADRVRAIGAEISQNLDAAKAMLVIFSQADPDEESQAFIEGIQASVQRLETLWREYVELTAPTAIADAVLPPLQVDGHPASILVVDDDAVQQVFAARCLERAGAKVTVAVNGQDAVQQVKAGRFDLVLMDCQMPILDGFGAVGAIRAREEPGKRVPIIAFTAHKIAGYKQRCLQVGMDGYLAKPASAESLVKTVAKAIARSRKG